jgi:hypothetical protein
LAVRIVVALIQVHRLHGPLHDGVPDAAQWVRLGIRRQDPDAREYRGQVVLCLEQRRI